MHIPVLTEKILEYFDPKANQNFIDCTVGGGGHTFAILEKNGPKGKVLALDWDNQAIERLKEEIRKNIDYRNRIILEHANFAHLQDIVQKHKSKPVHGILFDLGFSSDHLQKSGRGFSFQKSEPLDMRYSLDNQVTAEKLIQYQSRSELERILKEYGEEEFAREIASEIVSQRTTKRIHKTTQLVEIIEAITPKWYQRKKIHPATKTFQAFRIAVNDELNNIRQGLAQAIQLLEPEGVIEVISFHSLEDRIVKNFFNSESNLHVMTKKPIGASANEIKNNPRARSAKLRIAVKKAAL